MDNGASMPGPAPASGPLGDADAASPSALDCARAEEFRAVVRPLPAPERALVVMGVAVLAEPAITPVAA